MSQQRPVVFPKISLFAWALLLFFLAGPAWGEQPQNQPQDKPASAEAAAEADRKASLQAYLKGYYFDTKAILTAPARWDAQDWLVAGAVVGVAAGLYAYDQDLKEWAQKRRNGTTDDIARFAEPFGKGLYTVPALGLLYAYGYAVEDGKARETALLGVESFVISQVFTQILKYATHRRRPGDGPRYDRWDGPGFSGEDISFPSAETTAAFSVATVIASEYDNTIYVPVIAYGIASMTALSRINDNDHWASDVFAGAAIGYFTARFLIRLHKNSRFAILPLLENGRQGLALGYRF